MNERAVKILADADRQLAHLQHARKQDEMLDADMRMTLSRYEREGWIDASVARGREQRLQSLVAMLTNGSPPQLVPIIVKTVFVTLHIMREEVKDVPPEEVDEIIDNLQQ